MSQEIHPFGAPIERTTYDAPIEQMVSNMAYQAGVFAGMAITERVIRDYDPLTNLLNRRGFMEVVDRTLEENPDETFGLAAIDLGNQKWVNTKLGHSGGDFVLCTIARALRRQHDEAGRFGGDELVTMFQLDRGPNNSSHEEQLASEVNYIQSIRTSLIASYPELDQGPIRVYVGAGAVVYDRSKSFDDNLKQADIACEANKLDARSIYGEMRIAVTI